MGASLRAGSIALAGVAAAALACGGGGNGAATPAAPRAEEPLLAREGDPHRTRAPEVDDDDDDGGLEVEGLRAKLAPHQIEDGVRPHQRALTACYAAAAKRARWLGGTVELAFAVGPDGAVSQVRLGKGDVGSWAVERCLLGVARGMTFAAPSGAGEAEFTLPLDFASGRSVAWWDEAQTDAEIAPKRADLDACDAGEGGAPRDVRVTLYVGNRGEVKSVGFASPAAPIPDAWAECASAAIAAWKLTDPRGEVAKAGFRHRPE